MRTWCDCRSKWSSYASTYAHPSRVTTMSLRWRVNPRRSTTSSDPAGSTRTRRGSFMHATNSAPSGRNPSPEGASISNTHSNEPSGWSRWTVPPSWSETHHEPSRQRGPSGNFRPGIVSSRNRPLQWKAVDTGDTTDVERDVGAVGERVLGDAAVPLLDRDLELEPREVRPEAPVRAGGERDVAVARAVDVELVRTRELHRISVGRRDGQEHAVTGLHRAARELDVARHDAIRRDDRVGAQCLLDERRDALR